MTEEYTKAIEKLKTAQNHFDYAAEGFIDAAIYELAAAEQKVQALARAAEG